MITVARAASANQAALYQTGCESGDAESCYGLGVLYQEGDGFAKDASKAASLYQRACDGGALSACHALGRLHLIGNGVVKDAVKAAALYRKSCEGEHERRT